MFSSDSMSRKAKGDCQGGESGDYKQNQPLPAAHALPSQGRSARSCAEAPRLEDAAEAEVSLLHLLAGARLAAHADVKTADLCCAPDERHEVEALDEHVRAAGDPGQRDR